MYSTLLELSRHAFAIMAPGSVGVDGQKRKTYEVIDPSRPASHVWDRKRKTSVDDDSQNQDRSWCHSLGESSGDGSDSTEQHGHN